MFFYITYAEPSTVGERNGKKLVFYYYKKVQLQNEQEHLTLVFKTRRPKKLRVDAESLTLTINRVLTRTLPLTLHLSTWNVVIFILSYRNSK